MTSFQADGYKFTQSIDYLADLPGADKEKNQLMVVVEGGDLDVQEDTPLDVSGAVVDVQEDTPLNVSGAVVDVQEDTPLNVSGAVVDVQEDTPLDVSSRSGRDLGKARVADSGGTLLDPVDAADAGKVEATDAGTGTANAAEISGAGPLITTWAVYWDSSGGATLTIEAKIDGSWTEIDSVSISSADSNLEVYPDLPYTDLRAYLDQNRNQVTLTGKGVS